MKGRVRVHPFLVGVVLVAGCGEDPSQPQTGPVFAPTDARLLSTGSPTKDEDPSVIRARDGTLFVAWFSDRGGNPDIYVTSTRNGSDWSSPARVTTSVDGDFNPSLHQDGQGTFHLAWFRWDAPFRGHIWYNTSPDGLAWDPGAEVQVTTAPDFDDWVPTITQATDGTLLIYFVSAKRNVANRTNEIYVTAKRLAVAGWDAPVPVAGLNSATEHDHLPFAARTGGEITLVWVRYDTTQAIPWLNAKSDLVYSTSSDGLNWAPAAKITSDSGNAVNLFPALYSSLDAKWSIVWLSTRLGPPRVFELPLAGADLYPQGLVVDTLLTAGYSHRIAATPTPGVYIGVWVQGPDGAQDIYYRFFAR